MKKVALVIAIVAVLPLYVGMQLCVLIFRGERAFVSVGTFLGQCPGIIGDFMRKAYYLLALGSFSSSAGIGYGSFFSHRSSSMGPRSSCGAYCVLGTCDIGEGVLLGSNVHILSGKGQHMYDDAGRLVDGHFDRVAIGDHTWVGNGAIIMASIGKGCIVAAGAVVVKEVEDHCIVGGNPAKILRRREQ